MLIIYIQMRTLSRVHILNYAERMDINYDCLEMFWNTQSADLSAHILEPHFLNSRSIILAVGLLTRYINKDLLISVSPSIIWE